MGVSEGGGKGGVRGLEGGMEKREVEEGKGEMGMGKVFGWSGGMEGGGVVGLWLVCLVGGMVVGVGLGWLGVEEIEGMVEY